MKIKNIIMIKPVNNDYYVIEHNGTLIYSNGIDDLLVKLGDYLRSNESLVLKTKNNDTIRGDEQ